MYDGRLSAQQLSSDFVFTLRLFSSLRAVMTHSVNQCIDDEMWLFNCIDLLTCKEEEPLITDQYEKLIRTLK